MHYIFEAIIVGIIVVTIGTLISFIFESLSNNNSPF